MRRLLRERDALIGERTRLGNRIRSLLMLHGIFGLSPYKKDFLEWLRAVSTGYGQPLPPCQRRGIERAVAARLRMIQDQLAKIEAEKAALAKAVNEAREAEGEAAQPDAAAEPHTKSHRIWTKIAKHLNGIRMAPDRAPVGFVPEVLRR